MFGIGRHTVWLDMHGLLMFLTLIFGAYLFGAIYFARDPSEEHVRRLKISGVVTFALFLLLMISGIVPDAAFDSGATFSARTSNDFGTFTSHVTDSTLGAFTGPLLFDMMEHVSLIVPGLVAVVGYLILHFGREAMTVPAIRRSVLSLMLVTAGWTLVLGMIGVYITKVLTFPAGQ